jgi:hypothetical protein
MPLCIWGVEKEDEARTAYSFVTGHDVTEVGLYKHPTIIGSHASPDGLVGHDGCIEIKCPNSATHIETLKSNQVAHISIYSRCNGRWLVLIGNGATL